MINENIEHIANILGKDIGLIKGLDTMQDDDLVLFKNTGLIGDKPQCDSLYILDENKEQSLIFYNLKDIEIRKIQDFLSRKIYNNVFFVLCTVSIKDRPDLVTGIVYKENSKIEKDLYFYSCTFNTNFTFKNIEFNGINFVACDFGGIFRFMYCLVNKDISFKSCIFKENTDFLYTIFSGNSDFSGAKFIGKANFTNSVFRKFAIFYGSIFENYVSFYGVKFVDIINFSTSTIDKSINLVNSTALISFEDLKYYIESYIGKIKEKNELSNDLRDTFRFLKNSLIKENNLLDASKYHRSELYCKEIEIVNKENRNLRDWFDLMQLKIYRFTSDHHTDLAKILFYTLFLIGLFGALFSCFDTEYHRANIMLFILFSSFIFGLIYTIFDSSIKHIIMFPFCILGIYFFLFEPKLVNPIGFIDIRNGNIYSALKMIYYILFWILAFSLQKTARKNSIVPS